MPDENSFSGNFIHLPPANAGDLLNENKLTRNGLNKN